MTECEGGPGVHLLAASSAVVMDSGTADTVLLVMLSMHQQDVAAKICLEIAADGGIKFDALLLVLDEQGNPVHRRFLRALWPV